jgi:transcriptional regulator GlxA family with amidase domain
MLMTSVAKDHCKSAFHVGILPLPNFTLLAFSSFVDTLRLAADEGDMSRPLNCRWTVVSPTLEPVTSSCGVQVTPWEPLSNPDRFDYIAVVGGRWAPSEPLDPALVRWLRAAADSSVKLIGLCLGTVALIKAGVMQGRQSCISGFHAHNFAAAFPDLTPITDQWFHADRDRITSPGGVAAADVAAFLVSQHCGEQWAKKALRMGMIQAATPAHHPQPFSTISVPLEHRRLRRAVGLLERRLYDPPSIDELAAHSCLSARQLQRLFRAQFGCGPHEFSRTLRLRYGLSLLERTDRSVADIAASCGFRQTPHFCRQFKALFGISPTQARLGGKAVSETLAEQEAGALRLRPEGHLAFA